MKIRVISAVAIAVILILTLVTGGYVLAGVLLVLSQIAYTEVNTACGISEEKGFNLIGIAGNVAICVHYFFLMRRQDASMMATVIMGMLVVMLLIYVIRYPRYHIGVVLITLFSFLYAPMMLSFLYLIRGMERGAFFAWLPFVAWVSDSCAYLTGVKFGRHKLAPKLSPKKSVEGAAGGVAGSAVAGLIYGIVIMLATKEAPTVIPVCMVIAIAGSVLSQIGDLVASGIKRDHKIKDYGSMIPGHGGIMDRFDSVIFVTPMVYMMLTIMVR